MKELFFYIFRAKYYVVRSEVETFYGISRVVEENFLLLNEDKTIEWMESQKESTVMGFFQASIWVWQLKRNEDDYYYSKVTLNDFNSMHFSPGYSLFI